MSVDGAGNLYVADTYNEAIDKISASGNISIFAGRGVTAPASCTSASPCTATQVGLFNPADAAVDPSGNVYIADNANGLVEKVTPGGSLSVFAGNGGSTPSVAGCTAGSPCSATQVAVPGPAAEATDAAGDVYIATSNNYVVKVTPGGSLTIVAGTGAAGAPTAGSALGSALHNPDGLAVDGAGNLYIADYSNNVVERVTTSGQLSVFAGGGATAPSACTASSACVATQATVTGPNGVSVDASGNLYIVTQSSYALKVTPSGSLSTIAGNGTAANPTPGPAVSSHLSTPNGVAVDSVGNVYIADAAVLIDEIGAASVPPAFTAATPPPATDGVAYSYTFSASGNPVPNFAVASGSLPPGLTLNTATGVLSGTPAGAGTFTVRATNTAGSATAGPFTLGSAAGTGGGATTGGAVVAGGGGLASTPDGSGFWTVGPTGVVTPHGSAAPYGSPAATHLNQPIVGMASTPDGKGYWLVAADGGVFAYGDAAFAGSHGASFLNQPIVGMASTPDGKGYWLVAADGGVFAYGDAAFAGSHGASFLNQPIVGMASTPDGKGYWLVAADGGVFAYGDAAFAGSHGASFLNQPIVGMASTPDGKGYWLVAADGGVFAYGDAAFAGSGAAAGKKAIGLIPAASGTSYELIDAAGVPIPLLP